MAVGSFFRAVQRTGGITPIINTFKDLMDKQAQQKFYDSTSAAYNNYLQKQKALAENQPDVTTHRQIPIGNGINNNLNPLPLQNQSQDKTVQQIAQKQGITPNTNNNPLVANITDTTPFNPRNLNTYNQAQDLTNDFTSQRLIEALKTPGVDTSSINVLSSLLNSNADKYRPIPDTYKEIPQGGMLQGFSGETGQPNGKTIKNEKIDLIPVVTRDGNGDWVTKMVDKNDPQNAGLVGKSIKNEDKAVDKFIGTDNKPYITYKKNNGQLYTVDATTGQPAPTGVTVRQPLGPIMENDRDTKKTKGDVAEAETEIKGIQDQLNKTEPTILGSNYLPKPNPEYSRLNNKLMTAKAKLAKAKAAGGDKSKTENSSSEQSKENFIYK